MTYLEFTSPTRVREEVVIIGTETLKSLSNMQIYLSQILIRDF